MTDAAAPSEASLPSPPRNAVLDDQDLRDSLDGVHPAFGDLCTRIAGEAWGKPLIDQATKAMVAIAIDVVNQGLSVESPFEPHIRMALKQGVTFEQIEELLLFVCVYAGFNKAAPSFVRLAQIRAIIESEG
ncbi:MAG: carboxymuconolactone decarboxylase family protein [Cyanobium sp.]